MVPREMLSGTVITILASLQSATIPVFVSDRDEAVLDCSETASPDRHLHAGNHADWGNAGDGRRAHRKRKAVAELV
jgi:hypothetical protein